MLYKWIYDNLYPKDNSLLLGAVKKFCEKIGYTPDNMDEFVRFLTNFDFVSPYDEIFNSPSYISQLYKYLEKQYSSRFSNYKDYIVSRVDRLYNSDKYIRDKFKTFLFSYFFEDKRPAFDLSFDLFKTKKPEENSEEYLSKIERLSLGEVKQYFYNWLTLVAFFEFDLRWVYSTLKWLVLKAVSNVDAHGLQSQDKIFKNELEPYKWLDDKVVKIPRFLIELDKLCKFCHKVLEKGFVKYSDYIEKKGYSQEMEFRKIMLNELLAAFFIEYLTLFISFWEREYKYADAYIYLIKEGYPFSFKVGKNEVIENFLTFHPFVFGVWGMEYELVKNRYFIVYLRGEGEVYSSVSMLEYPARIQNVFYEYAEHVFSHPDLNRKMKEFLTSYGVPTDWVNGLGDTLWYFMSFLSSEKRQKVFEGLLEIPPNLLPYGTYVRKTVFAVKFLRRVKDYVEKLNSQTESSGKRIREIDIQTSVC